MSFYDVENFFRHWVWRSGIYGLRLDFWPFSESPEIWGLTGGIDYLNNFSSKLKKYD
jgi:hypothetical protein